MSEPLRIGILGCARIARRGVIGGIQKTSGARLVGIASRRREMAAAWAEEFAIPKVFDSYEALLADREIDAIYNPLPNELHRDWTLRAADAGKHVLCEKPLGVDADDAEATVEGCRREGVVLMEAFMWCHHPRVAHVRHMLAAGRLGELRLVKMDFSFDIDRGDWRLDPRRGGGRSYDLGCYGINAARLFTQEEPDEIVARAYRHTAGVDMTTGLMLGFPSGATALLDASFELPHRNRLELVGTHGALEFPGGVLPPPRPSLVFRGPSGIETIDFDEADSYAGEIAAFCESVALGRLVDPAEDGLLNMRALDWARRAALREA